MAENFPNLNQETDIQVQEAQKAPNKMDPKRPTPRNIIMKMANLKNKEKILKAAREKQRLSHKATPIRLQLFPLQRFSGQEIFRSGLLIQSHEREKSATWDILLS